MVIINGLTITVDSPGADAPSVYVLQYTTDADLCVDLWAELLVSLLDEYGPVTSRYSKKRLNVVVEEGDKYVSPNDGEGGIA